MMLNLFFLVIPTTHMISSTKHITTPYNTANIILCISPFRQFFKREFICLFHGMVYKYCNLMADTIALIIMNVVSAV